ncbi:MAG: ubiquinol-cytochrome c reductase iron-sulfur subunit [Gammaproteobacteria bacterium]
MSEKSGLNRRHFLAVATSVAGAAGVGMTAVPFVMSFRPSAKAQALGAPVQVDISKLEDGQMVRHIWRGKPVWVLRRSPAMLERMHASEAELADPDSEVETQQPAYAKNADRAVKPEVLVVLGVCTHLGCAPLERFDVAPADLGPDWVGGFYCPCHGSKFDLAGRVYAGVPAPTNLVVPPYRYLSETLILVGDDTGVSA